MAYNGSGTYIRVTSWQADATAKIKILSNKHDTQDDDFANALSNVICKDGQSQPTSDIPMNGHKFTNLSDPVAATDSVNKRYVDGIKTFATGMTISGSDSPNGQLTFSATTGFTGLSWTNADMSWIGRIAETGKWQQRVAMNGKGDASGTDVVAIDKAGNITCTGNITNNLSYDGTTWRVNTKGTGMQMRVGQGNFFLYSNVTATVTDNFAVTMTQFFQVNPSSITLTSQNDNALLQLQKKNGTGSFVSRVSGMVGGANRWSLDLADGAAESGTDYVGSNFTLSAWNNAGSAAKSMMNINRSSNLVQFYGDVYTNTGNFQSNSAQVVLAAQNGNVILRPGGAASAANQVYASNDGNFHVGANLTLDNNTTQGASLGMGFQGKNGTTGGYTGNYHNFVYFSSKLYAFVDVTNVGQVSLVCDYRTKRNIEPLASTWDKVKSLRPITYQYQGVPDMIGGDKDDDEELWGFVAHDLQATLTHSAASFDKDAPNALQSPNLMVVVAALTRALQEAQQRIEALEARLA
jgi:hypothetical protein